MQAILHRMDRQQGPLYNTENSIQSPVINHNKKEYFNKNIYTCLTESLCCTEVTRRCESLTLHFNKNKTIKF